MRLLISSIALSTLLAGVALAEPFYVGTWAYNGGSCSTDGAEGGALRLSESTFWGLENKCEMTNPVEIRDMDGILFDMECWGEGTQYTYRFLVLQEYDGSLTTHGNGFTNTYQRCE